MFGLLLVLAAVLAACAGQPATGTPAVDVQATSLADMANAQATSSADIANAQATCSGEVAVL